MPIRITPSDTPIPVHAIVTLILGNPGVGKTSLANTAERPLLLDFDRGAHRSLCRPDTVIIERWSDVEDLTQDDLASYRTLIVDTVGRCLDVLAVDIMTREPRLGTGGQLTLQGYGRLKGRFRSWLGSITRMGVNVVLVAHAVEERHGEEIRLRVDAQGSSKEDIYKVADLMGRITIRDNRRHLDFDPSDAGFGKNPAGIKPGGVPNPYQTPDYLAQCIRGTIESLTRQSETDHAEGERLTALREAISQITQCEELSALARKMREDDAPLSDRGILLDIARSRGWTLDRETLTFTDPSASDTP